MKRRYMVIPPTLILLPAKPLASIVLIRIDGSGGKANSRRDRLEGRSWAPYLPKPVIQRLILIIVQLMPRINSLSS